MPERPERGTGQSTDAEDSTEMIARREKLRKFLERRYSTRVVSFARLDRGVYRIDREEGRSWVARLFSARRTAEEVRGDADVLRYLEERGFPAERPAQPDPVSFAGGWGILLTEFVEGVAPAKSEQTLRAFGELVGRLDTLPPSPGGASRKAGVLHHYARGSGGLRKELDSASLWLDSLSDKISGSSKAVYESLRDQLAKVDDGEGLPESLIHPDPVLKNVIEARDAGLVVIDWTGAGRGPRIIPLAVVIWSSALGESGWSAEYVDWVVAGYRAHVQLQEEELDRLAGVMRVRPLVFACMRFRRMVEAGKKPDGKEWWMPSEDLVGAISSRARAAFERPVKGS